MKKVLTAREVWASDRIYWLKSYKAVLKYIGQDYPHIFKPIIKGSNSGTRYYIERKNLDKFLDMFENNELA